MEQNYTITLTERDRYFLSILFAMAGHLAHGMTYGAAINLSINAADYLKEQTKNLNADEQ